MRQDTSVYNAVGNLSYIYDYKAGSPQTQTFGYDAANRLTSASAGGTVGIDGAYNAEVYSYDSSGRLSSNAGMTLSYAAQSASCPNGALNKPDAVTSAGGNSYCYDLNGNMVKRTIGSNVYNLTGACPERSEGTPKTT